MTFAAGGGSVGRRDAWYHKPDVRRLGASLGVGLVLALVTGKDGRSGHFGSGIAAALGGVRVPSFLAVGLALWGVATGINRYGDEMRRALAPATAARKRVTGNATFRTTSLLVMLVVAIGIPPMLSSFWQGVLVEQVGIFMLLAVGLNVVVGWAGLLDLGYIAFYAIGAYTTAYFTGTLPVQPPIVLNPFLCFPLAVLACLLAGVLLGAPTLRLRGDYLAIVTLGFGEIVRIVANNSDGITNGSRGATNIPHFSIHLLGINYDWTLNSLPYWYLIMVVLAVVVLLFFRLEHSRIGRAWAAVREDEVAAQASGVATVKIKLLAFAIGASTSGLAGVIYASKIGFISPDNFLLILSISVLAYVVFGGMGSLFGVMVGAALLTWLPQFLRDYVPATDRNLYIGAILVLMMIFRPAGLLPARRRRTELSLHDIPEAETVAVPAPGSMGGSI
ncbi:MAG: branched-chain amino acid ABC transporter permease [Actinobacteria bacterium]|nr:branched-chain amino acid ABC transporter permease [Actinomycetota bacterium]